VNEQSAQFVQETSADLLSYLEINTTVLARHNKTLQDIAEKLYEKGTPFKLSGDLRAEF